MTTIRSIYALAAAALLLAGCATMPGGPAVPVLPGTGKTPDAFQADVAVCQQFAQGVLGNGAAPQAVNDRAAAGAIGTSAVGAASGAIIGSVSNQGGQGAAIGAGIGLLIGAINAANASSATQWQLQQQYDAAYLQCMFARGNQVPMRTGQRGPAAPAYAYPPAYPSAYPSAYPPPGTPPPYPPPGTPPPFPPPGTPSPFPPPGTPPPSIPPPDAPPPRG